MTDSEPAAESPPSPADSATLVGVCAVLLGVSVIAAYVPAVRATRIDPRQALAAD